MQRKAKLPKVNHHNHSYSTYCFYCCFAIFSISLVRTSKTKRVRSYVECRSRQLEFHFTTHADLKFPDKKCPSMTCMLSTDRCLSLRLHVEGKRKGESAQWLCVCACKTYSLIHSFRKSSPRTLSQSQKSSTSHAQVCSSHL